MSKIKRCLLFCFLLISYCIATPGFDESYFTPKAYILERIPIDSQGCPLCRIGKESFEIFVTKSTSGQIIAMLACLLTIWFNDETDGYIAGELSELFEGLFNDFVSKREYCRRPAEDFFPDYPHVKLVYLLDKLNCMRVYEPSIILELLLKANDELMRLDLLEHDQYHLLMDLHDQESWNTVLPNHNICRLLAYNYSGLKKLFSFFFVPKELKRFPHVLGLTRFCADVNREKLTEALDYFYIQAEYRNFNLHPNEREGQIAQVFRTTYERICLMNTSHSTFI